MSDERALRPLTQLGRYELVGALGRGGMAELYLGRLRGAGGFAKSVAIKRILPHLAGDPHIIGMFLDEGRIAAQLSHPNICQVFELAESAGEYFLVMEYLDGIPWDALALALPRGSARLRITAGVLLQICEALAYAHELRDGEGAPRAIVHRDVSPQNLFATVDGVCKLLDFGVSKAGDDVRRTRTGIVKGKLAYMPPEQIRGESVDVRADVFALGAVLWESLSGRRLFARPSDYLIYKAILEEPIPQIADSDSSFGPEVDALAARALARDRTQRIPTVRAFAEELRRIADAFGGPCTPAELAPIVRRHRDLQAAVPPTVITMAPDSDGYASIALRSRSAAVTRPPPRRRRWPAIMFGVALGTAIAGVALARKGDDAAPVQLPAPAAAPIVVTPVEPAPPQPPADVAPAPEPPAPPLPPPEAPRPKLPAKPAPPKPAAVERRGYLTIDSHPYATIYVDGRELDQTPIYRAALPAGRHVVRAVLADGRSRELTITIAPDRELQTKGLTW